MSYLCDLFFIFIMINLMNADTSYFACFLYALLVLDDDVMKNVNNFQIAKV